MDKATVEEIDRLDAALAQDPTSEDVRERLLEAFSADSDGYNDPRRFELIDWFLRNNPRHSICSTPFPC